MSHLIFDSGKAAFDGKETLTFPSLPLGAEDFTICLRARCDFADGNYSGDILSQFDQKIRTGFSLGLASLEASATSRVTAKKLTFGIDANTDPVWVDAGNPGGTTLFPNGFCEYAGNFYVATCTGEAGGKGGVWRLEGAEGWVDCKCPCVSNSVHALTVHDGILCAAAAVCDTAGTHLAPAGNMKPDGHVYGYDGTHWQDYGKVSECNVVFGLTVLNGVLYASALDQFTDATSQPANGLYRMSKPGHWEFCGNPGERVCPITAKDGRIIAGGYNKGRIYAYDPASGTWEDWGNPHPATTQIYSFVDFNGELLAGTWKGAKVFAIEAPHRYRDLGLLGREEEVMGMAVYNGKLYAGTLPLAQIYRYEGGTEWTLVDRLEHTDTEYRRAWSMGIHGERLFCGVVPSGRIYAMTAGRVVTLDEEFPPGWHHVTAVRCSNRLSLYLDGKKVAEQAEPPRWIANRKLDLSSGATFRMGDGPAGPWKGAIADVRIYGRVLDEGEISALASEPK